MSAVDDLAFFQRVAQAGSLTGAARDLGLSLSAVSKRLQQLEARLGVSLAARTTRRLSLTAEGERYLTRGAMILDDLGDLENSLRDQGATLSGRLRINATFGFGRRHVAPLISRFAALHPQLELLLELTSFPQGLDEQGFDINIRVGEPPDSRWIARRLLANRRMLCAAPHYLANAPKLEQLEDLADHHCLIVRENDTDYSLWRFEATEGARIQRAIRVHGRLASNDAEAMTRMALDGHGILLRSWWDVHEYLASGELVPLLPQWQGIRADFYLLYAGRARDSARIRQFVEFMTTEMAGRVPDLPGASR
ncbi:LysR family transcriptional regulator [Chromohalobacter marismortui]|uniref:LysR family transcriptional regulator n=1 Tax=Chromohalobacter marismortui TaxID=42055 RepID=A0A4R7NLN6_9GAMM|nr:MULTISPECIES: LysR family transcriptional regulator [Chromohalobacter]MCI0510256.1 LysR family transcriptional regulator [Chromohalobacter sp.]MCI0593432.1 LysR family transcriptional regulator [Chromohalobacter sp.]TDU21674.1 LysR family transcriptional regulator [Chromohalobacter marismortui]